jgi:hypothetical protein
MIVISLSIEKSAFSADSVPLPSHLTSCTHTKSKLYFVCPIQASIMPGPRSLKDKIKELAKDRENKNIRDLC